MGVEGVIHSLLIGGAGFFGRYVQAQIMSGIMKGTSYVAAFVDDDPKKVGKAFTRPAVESALASYPGMFPTAPPADGSPSSSRR